MKTYRSAPDPREAEVIANATGYVAVGFQGRGRFARQQHSSLASARTGAQALANELGRTVAIYAVLETNSIPRQAHVENAEPQRGKQNEQVPN